MDTQTTLAYATKNFVVAEARLNCLREIADLMSYTLPHLSATQESMTAVQSRLEEATTAYALCLEEYNKARCAAERHKKQI